MTWLRGSCLRVCDRMTIIKLVKSLKKLLKKFETTHKIIRRLIIMIDQGWDYHKKTFLVFFPQTIMYCHH
jgi:hypothetical protein